MAKKEIGVMRDDTGAPIGLDEIKTAGASAIENVTDPDLVKSIADLEAFMNERLVIVVYDDGIEGSLQIIRPTVNGVSQPIIRGVQTKVKRKYVEALARGINTSYTQREMDPTNKASLKMIPANRQTYPFVVIHDPNPEGREWLENIMREKV